MPEQMEQALEAEADRKGLTGERRRRYIFGAMRKRGWKPERERHSGGGGRMKRGRGKEPREDAWQPFEWENERDAW